MSIEWFIILNFIFAGLLLGAWLFAEWRVASAATPLPIGTDHPTVSARRRTQPSRCALADHARL